jgi:hypothetical protein
MKYCLFIVSIPHLHSYEILSDVATLYEAYLRLRGHTVVISDKPRSDFRNIMFGVNVAPPNLPLPKNTIIVDLEQATLKHPNGAPTAYSEYLNYLRQYHVWTYSYQNYCLLKQRGIHRVRWVPIGSVPVKLPTPIPTSPTAPTAPTAPTSPTSPKPPTSPTAPTAPKPPTSPTSLDIDVLFIGHLWERRALIKHQLIQAKIPNVVFADTAWGSDRDNLIARAKIILNIGSFDSVHQFEIVRILPLLQRKKFIISETADNITEYQYLFSGLVICPYSEIVAKVKDYLSPAKASERTRIGQLGYDAIQRYQLHLPLLDFDSTDFTKLYQTVVPAIGSTNPANLGNLRNLNTYFQDMKTVYCRSSQPHLSIIAAYQLFQQPSIQNVILYTATIPSRLHGLIPDLGLTVLASTPSQAVDLIITDGSSFHLDDLTKAKRQILIFTPSHRPTTFPGWSQHSTPLCLVLRRQ